MGNFLFNNGLFNLASHGLFPIRPYGWGPGNRSFYSTSSNIKPPVLNNQLTREKFLEFFRGFTDGEGCFMITNIKSYLFQFSFVIKLHIDDLKILEYIKDELGVGNIYVAENHCRFKVSNLKDLLVIINIFKNHSLNTTKHLNFINFEKAYTLYVNSTNKDETLANKILILKSNMNKERSDYTLPENHSFYITNYWLLGFIEAEGCFYGEKSNLRLGFSVSQSSQDKDLLVAIKDYFCNVISTNEINKDSIAIYEKKEFNNTKAVTSIYITNFDIIVNLLIPFFDGLSWQSKKRLDYEDWRLIVKIKELGLHYLPEGQAIVLAILDQMNNYRLSTNKATKVDRNGLYQRADLLLNSSSNFELLEDGSKLIKSKGVVFSSRTKTKVALTDNEGNIIKTFDSMVDCGKYLGIYSSTVKYKIKNNKSVNFKNNVYLIKEV